MHETAGPDRHLVLLHRFVDPRQSGDNMDIVLVMAWITQNGESSLINSVIRNQKVLLKFEL